MRQLLNLTKGLLAVMLLVVTYGCSPPDGGGSASLAVPEGMESATFSVSGMV